MGHGLGFPQVGAGGGNGSFPKIRTGLGIGKIFRHHLGGFPQSSGPQDGVGGGHPLEQRAKGSRGDGFDDGQFGQVPFFFPKAMGQP